MLSVDFHTLLCTYLNRMLLLPLLLLLHGPPASCSCPTGWDDSPSYLGLGCLLFNRTREVSWQEANDYCRQEQWTEQEQEQRKEQERDQRKE